MKPSLTDDEVLDILNDLKKRFVGCPEAEAIEQILSDDEVDDDDDFVEFEESVNKRVKELQDEAEEELREKLAAATEQAEDAELLLFGMLTSVQESGVAVRLHSRHEVKLFTTDDGIGKIISTAKFPVVLCEQYRVALRAGRKRLLGA